MERVREARLASLGQWSSLADIGRIVYPLARHIGASVVAIHAPEATPNFHVAVLDQAGPEGEIQRVFLLHSEDYDAWAVALPWGRQNESDGGRPELHELRFLDHDGIAAAMADVHGISIWSSYDLSTPLPADFQARVPSDLAYWKPQRLGDALFNWWD
jgi:hypothetical protein